jgi:hypothetical protein
LGGAAAVIFGGGPLLSRTDLDVSKWTAVHKGLCVGSAVAGVIGVAVVIGLLVRASLPKVVTLATLPKKTEKQSEKPEFYPGDIQNMAEFRDRLRAYSWSAATAKAEAEATPDTDPTRKARLTLAANRLAFKRDVLRSRRAEILAQGANEIAEGRLSGLVFTGIALGSALAVAGAAIYLLTLSGKPPADTAAAGSSASTNPVPAMLVRNADGSSKVLWHTLRLHRCRQHTAPDVAGVPVLKLSGTGTAKDPYTVQTIGQRPHCPRMTFTVLTDVAKLVIVEPTTATITYSPQPSPSETK